MNITKEQAIDLIANSVSKSEVARKLGKHPNQIGLGLVNKIVETYGLDTSHFSQKAAMTKFNRKWEPIEKSCPVCGQLFETKKNHPREQFTCSHACSNTHFAIKRNKPEKWKNYRTICFKHWERKCILCGFDKVVEVHHLDYNNKNNHKDNLVPVCPNHHQMIHTNEWGEQTVNEIKEKLRGVG